MRCPRCARSAARFEVSAPTILEIIERRSWAHLGEEPTQPAPSEEDGLRDVAAMLGRHNIAWESNEMLRFATQVIEAAKREGGASAGRRASDHGGAASFGDRRRRSTDPA